MWKKAFKKHEMIWWLGIPNHFKCFIKAVFHKFYLVHSWILSLNDHFALNNFFVFPLTSFCFKKQLINLGDKAT